MTRAPGSRSRGDRPPRLVEATGGQAVGLVDGARDVGVDAAVVGEQAGALELERQRRERVGEDVVHLAREATALGGRGGAGLGRLRDLEGEVLLTHPPHLAHDEEPGDRADQRSHRLAPVIGEPGHGPEHGEVEAERPDRELGR
jgi:hypothetical protein